MGIVDKFTNMFTDPEDGEGIELTQEEAEAVSPYEKGVISSEITANTNIVLFEPRNFDEAEEIAHHLKSKRACCVNLHRLPSEYRQRIIDFLTGVAYGIDGTVKRLGGEVYLCSPNNLQVGGNINLNSEE